MTTKQWDEIKISDLFDSMATGDWGQNPTLSSSVPVIRSTNFRGNGYLDLSDVVYRAVSKDRLQSRTINQGDILFEKSGGGPMQPAGRVAYSQTDLSGTASNFIEIGKVKNKFDKKFTFYLLHHLYLSGLVLKYQQQTTGIINFKIKEYFKETVKVPNNKKEQSKIAEILSTIDRAIAQTEALIAKHQRIKTGLMQDLLTRGIDEHGQLRDESTHKFKSTPLGMIPVEWEESNLGKISHRITSGSRGWARYYSDAGAKFIRIGNLTREHVNLRYENLQYVQPPDSSETKRTVLETGDVLISVTADLGIIGVVPHDLGEAYINQHIALVKLDKESFNPYFVGNLLSGFQAQKYFSNLNDSGAKAGLNLKTIAAFPVVFPKKEEQDRIAEIILKADKIIQAKKIERKKLLGIKTGLMQDLLSGQVRVRV